MSFTITAAGQDEPEITVPVSFIGDAAELLALAAELIDSCRDGLIRARLEALLDAKGAEPRPAAGWVIASVGALGRQAEEILAYEGIACERGLARYWRRPQAPRQGG